MSIIYNPNWRLENSKCHFCGETRSVKYKTNVLVIDMIPTGESLCYKVSVCNKCALILKPTSETRDKNNENQAR